MSRALIGLLLVGCVPVTEPIAPERLEPPAQYVEWAEGVMDCARRPRAHAKTVVSVIEWYVVDGFQDHRDDQYVWGLWDDGRVYLVREAVDRKDVVQHEIKHHLLWGDWKHKHGIWKCEA